MVGEAVLHGAVVADVVVKVLWLLRRARVFAGPFVRLERALGEAAADLVRGGPHHLRVVAHFEQIVERRAVREVVLLQKPRLDGKHPDSRERERNLRQ